MWPVRRTTTIWIANDVWGVDPAFRRRFSYAIEFKPLTPQQRRRVWRRHLGPSLLSDADVEKLAERFTVSAGQIATAVGSARLVAAGEPDRGMIEEVVAPLERLVRGRTARRPRTADLSAYSIDAVNASRDLAALADQLTGWKVGDGPGVSLCLYGPPGTGKSEFVRYLARRMGRRVIVRRASDILSMWVGEAEKNIALAFEEAERDDAVLLFDEADSFLQDRRRARASWEVSGVNEFLQQLEVSRGIVACTTNLFRDLDQAALRRFVLKVEFKYLDAERAWGLFCRLLLPLAHPTPTGNELRETERELGRIENLAPGDFACVARQLRAMGALPTRASLVEIVEELRVEVQAKEGSQRAIGF